MSSASLLDCFSLDGLLRASWEAAWLAAVVLLLELCFGRWIPARGRTLLWGLVVLRLCMPVLPPDPLGRSSGSLSPDPSAVASLSAEGVRGARGLGLRRGGEGKPVADGVEAAPRRSALRRADSSAPVEDRERVATPDPTKTAPGDPQPPRSSSRPAAATPREERPRSAAAEPPTREDENRPEAAFSARRSLADESPWHRVESGPADPEPARSSSKPALPRDLAATSLGAPPSARPPSPTDPPSTTATVASDPHAASPEAAGENPPADDASGMTSALVVLWALGVIVVTARLFWRERAFRRKLAREPLVRGRERLDVLDECRSRLGLRRPVQLIETHLVEVPAVLGIRRPTILLPLELQDELHGDRLRHVLLHELCHVRGLDVLQNALLSLVQAVHWFNPLVLLVRRRFDSAREELRDQQAVRAAGLGQATEYARTLLELAPRRAPPARFVGAQVFSGRRVLRRRILALANPRPSSPARRLASGLLAVGLAWLGLTSARGLEEGSRVSGEDASRLAEHEAAVPSPAPSTKVIETPGSSSRTASDWKTIPVTRPQTAAESAGLHERLHEPTEELSILGQDWPRAFSILGERAATSVVLDPEIRANLGLFDVDLEVHRTLAEALDLLCQLVDDDTGWCIRDGAIHVGMGFARSGVETRFYDVDGLLLDAEDPEHELERLVELVIDAPLEPGSWDHERVAVRSWHRLLCVTQTPANHERVHAFLEGLHNQGRPRPDTEAPRPGLHEALKTPIPAVSFEGQELRFILRSLSALAGVRVDADEELLAEIESEGLSFDLDLKNAELGQILRWIGRQAAMHGAIETEIRVEDDHLRLCLRTVRGRLHLYPVHDLLSAQQRDPDDAESELEDLLWQAVDGLEAPEGTSLSFWRGILLARHSDEAHRILDQYVHGLRRSLSTRDR